jgi:hypothetical protein
MALYLLVVPNRVYKWSINLVTNPNTRIHVTVLFVSFPK